MLKVQCERPDCQGANMQMADRHGIEIDYCTLCRGVWLDRGELDKIIERAAAYDKPPKEELYPPQSEPQRQASPPPQQYPPQQVPPGYVEYDDDYWEDYHKKHGRYPKRRSFLGEVFDIFD